MKITLNTIIFLALVGSASAQSTWSQNFESVSNASGTTDLFVTTTTADTLSAADSNALGFSNPVGFEYTQVLDNTFRTDFNFPASNSSNFLMLGNQLATATSSINFSSITVNAGSGFNLKFDYSLSSDNTASLTYAGTTWNLTQGDNTFNQTFQNSTASSITQNIVLNASSTGAWTSLMIDNIVLIPEPSSALLGGIGALVLLRRRRA